MANADDAAFMQAKMLRDEAMRALDLNKTAEALSFFRQSLEALGNRYRAPATIDDTEMKLQMAQFKASRGEGEASAALYASVIASRLAMYTAMREREMLSDP